MKWGLYIDSAPCMTDHPVWQWCVSVILWLIRMHYLSWLNRVFHSIWQCLNQLQPKLWSWWSLIMQYKCPKYMYYLSDLKPSWFNFNSTSKFSPQNMILPLGGAQSQEVNATCQQLQIGPTTAIWHILPLTIILMMQLAFSLYVETK